MTWNDLAVAAPEFVQWIVARYGPLPDGDVDEADFNRFAMIYHDEAER